MSRQTRLPENIGMSEQEVITKKRSREDSSLDNGDDDEDQDKQRSSSRICYHGSPVNDSSEEEPFLLDPGMDSYILEMEDLGNKVPYFIELQKKRNELMTKFSSPLDAFPNGSFVNKRCAPWGKNYILSNQQYRIEEKIFTSNGEVMFIKLSAKGRRYMIDDRFFSGWTDDTALERKRTYHENK